MLDVRGGGGSRRQKNLYSWYRYSKFMVKVNRNHCRPLRLIKALDRLSESWSGKERGGVCAGVVDGWRQPKAAAACRDLSLFFTTPSLSPSGCCENLQGEICLRAFSSTSFKHGRCQ
jgi:hypothetical protein